MRHCQIMFPIVLAVLVAGIDAGAYVGGRKRDCYGSITGPGLSPTGKRVGGVSASKNEVKYNLGNLQKYKKCFDQAADANCIEASLIAAIASRESGGGTALKNGYGDGGKAWGIMQCDINRSGLDCKQCAWDSCCHVGMMVEKKLIPDIRRIAKKFPSWTKSQVLQGAAAAYNFGVSNVQSLNRLDVGSTGGDYSNDVIARAQYLRSIGWY